jgi:plastocyanin
VNRIYLFPASLALTLAASLACAAGETITVKVKSLSYDPKVVVAQVGDTVVWSNSALTKHTATSDDDGKTFDTAEIKPDETSRPVKFEKAGEFNYHCKVHGKSMGGTIVVKPAQRS